MGSLLRKDLEKGGVLSQMLAGTNYILLLALFSQMGTQKGAGSAQGPDLRLQEVTVELAQLSESFVVFRSHWIRGPLSSSVTSSSHHYICSDCVSRSDAIDTYCRLVQFSSVTQLFPNLCNRMDCSMPGLPVHYQLPEFTQNSCPLS